jgi:hypothetical protein
MPSLTSFSSNTLPGVSIVHRLMAAFFTLLSLFSLVQPVKADAGDVLAGLIGAVMALVVICAVIGWWSRRVGGGSSGGGSSSGATDS